MCRGCLVPIAFGLKETQSEVEKEAVKEFRENMEKEDKRGLKLEDYLIWHDDKFLLDHCFEPNVVGHLVLQPVEHFTQFHESSEEITKRTHMRESMSEGDALELISIARKVSTLLEDCLSSQGYPPEKIYLCYFNEAPDWHLHFHIIPRARQEVIVGPHLMTMNKIGRKITDDEVKKVVKCLKEKLSTC